MQDRKIRVIFLCCHNSVTSQMAEAFLRKYGGTEFEVYSAGLKAHGIDPLTIKVMEEVGIDLADHHSEPLRKYWGKMLFDYLVIMCEKADRECFVFPGVTNRLVWPFDDPGTYEMPQETKLQAFRRTRDSIQELIEYWLKDRKGLLPANRPNEEMGSVNQSLST